MSNRTITHRFHLPRPVAADVRRRLERPRLRERLRLREAVGYLPGDREAVPESAPATVLTGLEVAANGMATATLEALATEEGRIVGALARRLDNDQYHFELVRDDYGDVLGIDFETTDTARRIDVMRALQGRAGRFDADDAREIASILVPPDLAPRGMSSTTTDVRDRPHRL